MGDMVLMRLAYVDPRPIPDVRAMPMQLLQTVDGLARVGVEVTLIASSRSLAYLRKLF